MVSEVVPFFKRISSRQHGFTVRSISSVLRSAKNWLWPIRRNVHLWGRVLFLGQSKKPVANACDVLKVLYLYIMKQWQVLHTVFPDIITENFDFTDYSESPDKLEYWLDEREYMSREDYKKGTVRSYGFTDYKTIQDFPIRGRSVYLHVRRRKWIDRSTGEIFTYDLDNLTESGSKLTPEFVAFLKEED